MRIRAQSITFVAALLMYLFFCNDAFSNKKNSADSKRAESNVKVYKTDDKKEALRDNRDITQNEKAYGKTGSSKQNSKQETTKSNVKEKDKNSTQRNPTEYNYYIVKQGDTTYGIAKKSKIDIDRILEINNLNENSKIFTGMKLKIPSENTVIKNDNNLPKKNNDNGENPQFSWPLKKVNGYSKDGEDGVNSIGMVIKGNPKGDVIASESGVVGKVGYMRGYGKYIVVKHEKRYITVYSNLMEVNVKSGDKIKKGAKIGNISEDMTLHFQIDYMGKPENPLNLLPKKG
ncbi:MAG: peptidoglycan DD-metalloendopeptidase family protein [Spirochaetes bacterium]|nr:peptidoglycan DD-metalloendopeptidase family protein [Spirochaetota bacterium]